MARAIDVAASARRQPAAGGYSEVRGLRPEQADVSCEPQPVVVVPPPPGLSRAFEDFTGRLDDGSELSALLRVGDLHAAVTLLISENQELNQELLGAQSDFEELRNVNVSIQEQMDAALATADNQRLELLEALEVAQDRVTYLESQVEKLRNDYETEIAQLQSERDLRDTEIFELGRQLADRGN